MHSFIKWVSKSAVGVLCCVMLRGQLAFVSFKTHYYHIYISVSEVSQSQRAK